ALHFADECAGFESMEEALENGKEALTAPNFFQEVMEALRRTIREGRTNAQNASAWLTVLDSYNITPIPVHPCAGSATWLIAAQRGADLGNRRYSRFGDLRYGKRNLAETELTRKKSMVFSTRSAPAQITTILRCVATARPGMPVDDLPNQPSLSGFSSALVCK